TMATRTRRKGTRTGAQPATNQTPTAAATNCTRASIPLGPTVPARHRRVDGELHGIPAVPAEQADCLSRDEKKTPDYYNVESYVKESSKKSKPRSLPERIIRRILGVFDPTRGFWIILLGLPVTFGLAVGLVMLGLKYGAIGFYGGVGLILSIG